MDPSRIEPIHGSSYGLTDIDHLNGFSSSFHAESLKQGSMTLIIVDTCRG